MASSGLRSGQRARKRPAGVAGLSLALYRLALSRQPHLPSLNSSGHRFNPPLARATKPARLAHGRSNPRPFDRPGGRVREREMACTGAMRVIGRCRTSRTSTSAVATQPAVGRAYVVGISMTNPRRSRRLRVSVWTRGGPQWLSNGREGVANASGAIPQPALMGFRCAQRQLAGHGPSAAHTVRTVILWTLSTVSRSSSRVCHLGHLINDATMVGRRV